MWGGADGGGVGGRGRGTGKAGRQPMRRARKRVRGCSAHGVQARTASVRHVTSRPASHPHGSAALPKEIEAEEGESWWEGLGVWSRREGFGAHGRAEWFWCCCCSRTAAPKATLLPCGEWVARTVSGGL
jgi:hypothetical protein